MKSLKEEYLQYVSSVKRYSPRTVAIYSDVLERFIKYCETLCPGDSTLTPEILTISVIRSWEAHLADKDGLCAKTVNLHISVLSGFCRWLCLTGRLDSNPVVRIKRPRLPKRLPVMFRREAMEKYLWDTARYTDAEFVGSWLCAEGGMRNKAVSQFYEACLRRQIISILYQCAIRRAELISLRVCDFDSSRRTLSVTGKGDKMREIPITDALCAEILLYLKIVEKLICGRTNGVNPLLVTPSGRALYPEFVDRAVKRELTGAEGISGRKSPHVLRHTMATELLENGTQIESIKEFLGHTSLAATQVYTHTSISQLTKVYKSAHPRAKNK